VSSYNTTVVTLNATTAALRAELAAANTTAASCGVANILQRDDLASCGALVAIFNATNVELRSDVAMCDDLYTALNSTNEDLMADLNAMNATATTLQQSLTAATDSQLRCGDGTRTAAGTCIVDCNSGSPNRTDAPSLGTGSSGSSGGGGSDSGAAVGVGVAVAVLCVVAVAAAVLWRRRATHAVRQTPLDGTAAQSQTVSMFINPVHTSVTCESNTDELYQQTVVNDHGFEDDLPSLPPSTSLDAGHYVSAAAPVPAPYKLVLRPSARDSVATEYEVFRDVGAVPAATSTPFVQPTDGASARAPVLNERESPAVGPTGGNDGAYNVFQG
jgi:hypothetical protein